MQVGHLGYLVLVDVGQVIDIGITLAPPKIVMMNSSRSKIKHVGMIVKQKKQVDLTV